MFEIQCLFKKIFGIECPACGITRSLKSILRGNISDAINNNPMVVLLPLLMIAILLKCNLNNKMVEKIINITIIAVLIIWIFWYLFLSNRVCWR